MTVVEYVLAGLLVMGGVRSASRWLGKRFDAASAGEQVLFALHIAARVGMWFAFAGFFVGYASVDDRTQFGWYIFVPIGLAGVQLLTGLALAREPSPRGDGPQA
ncbi:MAG TPA: hypothetical protein DIT48_07620 [Actinobacteria bacterium]|nr:hypothetical protein [Actinomycetota bacterium]HCP61619.1 hypothetical protein [Actinomycetota bacterium]